MAIIRSMGVGRARKSMGNVTYRTVRGRTIGSQKRGENPVTRAPGYYSQAEFTFAAVSMYMDAHKLDIALSFNKTKYGSERNNFFKLNYGFIREAIADLYFANSDIASLTISKISAAITTFVELNPMSIIRVKKTGFEVVYLSGEWNSSDNPDIPTPPVPPSSLRMLVGGTDVPCMLSDTKGSSTFDVESSNVVITGTGIGAGVTSLKAYKADGSEATDAGVSNIQISANRLSCTIGENSPMDTFAIASIELVGKNQFVIKS